MGKKLTLTISLITFDYNGDNAENIKLLLMKKIASWIFLTYLRFLAKIQLLKIRPKIIGITGTAGKTSARNAVSAVLQNDFKLKISYKANSETGLPLNILGLQMKSYSWLDWLRVSVLAPLQLLFNWKKYDIYIAEMGIDSPFPPKNMGYLLTIFKPHIGIFLNAEAMHSMEFDSLVSTQDPAKRVEQIKNLIAAEKGRMIEALPEDGAAILNTDDVNVFRFKDLIRAKIIGFGKNEQAQIKIKNINQSLDGTSFEYQFHHHHLRLNFPNYLLPDHYAHTFAAALACVAAVGTDLNKAAENLEQNYKLPPGRSSLIKGINQSRILDSSYNASAKPTIDALQLLDHVGPGRKLALLGDLRELGQETGFEHKRVAKAAKKVCDFVVLVGPAMKQYALPILQKAGVKSVWLPDAYRAAELLKKELQPKDMLLVKGSQNTLLLEVVVEKLMAEPERAEELLCRRGKYWDQKRKELIN